MQNVWWSQWSIWNWGMGYSLRHCEVRSNPGIQKNGIPFRRFLDWPHGHLAQISIYIFLCTQNILTNGISKNNPSIKKIQNSIQKSERFGISSSASISEVKQMEKEASIDQYWYWEKSAPCISSFRWRVSESLIHRIIIHSAPSSFMMENDNLSLHRSWYRIFAQSMSDDSTNTRQLSEKKNSKLYKNSSRKHISRGVNYFPHREMRWGARRHLYRQYSKIC